MFYVIENYYIEKNKMIEEKEVEELSEMNVTPFIDIMLVLLIIFMSVTPMMTSAIKVELPKSSKETTQKPQNPVVLFIDKEEKIYINEEEIALNDLEPILDEKTRKNKEEVIYFHIDKSIRYEKIMHTINKIQTIGYTKIALVSQKIEA